jgi:hypothetical protein
MLPDLESPARCHEVDWSCVSRGQLDSALARDLLRDFEQTKRRAMEEGEEKQERADAPVIIAPLVFLTKHRDGFARRARRKPYTPVLIPATLLRIPLQSLRRAEKDGELEC